MLWSLATLRISTSLSQRCIDAAPLQKFTWPGEDSELVWGDHAYYVRVFPGGKNLKDAQCYVCRVGNMGSRVSHQAAANAMWALVQLQRPQYLLQFTKRDIGELQPQEWANCNSDETRMS